MSIIIHRMTVNYWKKNHIVFGFWLYTSFFLSIQLWFVLSMLIIQQTRRLTHFFSSFDYAGLLLCRLSTPPYIELESQQCTIKSPYATQLLSLLTLLHFRFFSLFFYLRLSEKLLVCPKKYQISSQHIADIILVKTCALSHWALSSFSYYANAIQSK